MTARMRNLRRLAVTSAGALAMLAACAESDESERPVVLDPTPPLSGDAATDASLDVEAGDAEAAAVVIGDPSPPLQPCGATSPCPVAVPAPIPATRNLVAIAGSGRADVWAVGAASTVLHFDGTAWAAPAAWTGAASGQNTLRAIWLSRSDDVWFADGTDLVHSSGWLGAAATRFERTTARVPGVSIIPVSMSDLGGRGGDSTWGLVRDPSSAANVIVRWSPWADGGTSAVETPLLAYNPNRLVASSVPDANTVWSVGEGGKVYKMSRTAVPGAEWHVQEWNSHTTISLSDVSARDAEVWTVGAHGLVRRLGVDPDGLSRFLAVDTGSTANLTSIHVFAANDVWIVGERATILHFDGTSWWRVPTPFEPAAQRPALHAVWGADPDDVWFVGEGTTLRLQRSQSKR